MNRKFWKGLIGLAVGIVTVTSPVTAMADETENSIEEYEVPHKTTTVIDGEYSPVIIFYDDNDRNVVDTVKFTISDNSPYKKVWMKDNLEEYEEYSQIFRNGHKEGYGYWLEGIKDGYYSIILDENPPEGYHYNPGCIDDLEIPFKIENGKYHEEGMKYVLYSNEIRVELNRNFNDINYSTTHPFYIAIYYCKDRGFIKGYGDNNFGPDDLLTRGQASMMFYRINHMDNYENEEYFNYFSKIGDDEDKLLNIFVNKKQPFTDMINHPFTNATAFMYYYNISTGFNDGTFKPDNLCTRGQFITFLWRDRFCPEPESLNHFSDVNPNSVFAKAINWAYEQEITTGFDDGTFRQDDICTRAQAATFLYR